MIKAVVFDYGNVLFRNLWFQGKVFSLAEELRGQGVRTAILSNMASPIAWFIKRWGRTEGFGPVIYSCDAHVSKPHPEIYKILLKEIGLKAEECIFVDNRRDNLAAADKLGFHTVHGHGSKSIVEGVKKLLTSKN